MSKCMQKAAEELASAAASRLPEGCRVIVAVVSPELDRMGVGAVAGSRDELETILEWALDNLPNSKRFHVKRPAANPHQN